MLKDTLEMDNVKDVLRTAKLDKANHVWWQGKFAIIKIQFASLPQPNKINYIPLCSIKRGNKLVIGRIKELK